MISTLPAFDYSDKPIKGNQASFGTHLLVIEIGILSIEINVASLETKLQDVETG